MDEYDWLSAEFTTMERLQQVRAGERLGTVLDVRRDSEAGVSIAVVAIEWAPYPDVPDGDYAYEFYEVPDMHHSSLPHLEVLRDGRWQSVADLDARAMRAAGVA